MERSIQGYPSSSLLAGLEKAKLGGETPPKAFREGRFQLRDGILKLDWSRERFLWSSGS